MKQQKKNDSSWESFTDSLNLAMTQIPTTIYKTIKKRSPFLIAICILGIISVSGFGGWYALNRIASSEHIYNYPFQDPNYDDRNQDPNTTALGSLKSNGYLKQGYYENVYTLGNDRSFLIEGHAYLNITIKTGYTMFTINCVGNRYEYILNQTTSYYSQYSYISGDLLNITIDIDNDIPFDIVIVSWKYLNNGESYTKENPFYLDWILQYTDTYYVPAGQTQYFAIWKETLSDLKIMACGDYQIYYHDDIILQTQDLPYTGYYIIEVYPIQTTIFIS